MYFHKMFVCLCHQLHSEHLYCCCSCNRSFYAPIKWILLYYFFSHMKEQKRHQQAAIHVCLIGQKKKQLCMCITNSVHFLSVLYQLWHEILLNLSSWGHTVKPPLMATLFGRQSIPWYLLKPLYISQFLLSPRWLLRKGSTVHRTVQHVVHNNKWFFSHYFTWLIRFS